MINHEALEITARIANAIAFYSLMSFGQLQGLGTILMAGSHAFLGFVPFSATIEECDNQGIQP